jgi:predicted metal-binding membrane protein
LVTTKQKISITASLLIISVFAWWISLEQVKTTPISILEKPLIEGLVFVVVWTIMMVAMMLPSIIPMVLLFTSVAQSRKELGFQPAPPSAFIFGYLASWASIGVGLAFMKILGQPVIGGWNQSVVGGALIVAGIYQVSHWKSLCLGHCRSPMHFLMHSWNDGVAGAVRMGGQHGFYCIGCCWSLMLALIALGMMNIAWMGLIAFLIFIEKVMPRGELLAKIIGIGFSFVGLGILISNTLN